MYMYVPAAHFGKTSRKGVDLARSSFSGSARKFFSWLAG